MRSSISSLAFALSALGAQLPAQDTARAPVAGRIRGRVVADSGGAPIAGAEVGLPGSSRTVRTDSTGRFDFPGLSPESTKVTVRALGYLPDSTVVAVRNRLVVNLELRLAFETIYIRRANAPQPLPQVTTEAPHPDLLVKMGEFYERKKIGIGRFLDREQIAKWEHKRTSDMLATMGSIQLRYGGLRAWVSNGRANDGTCAFCRNTDDIFRIVNEADFAMGARAACYMDVWIDGTRVYEFGRTPPQPLFDMNAFMPEAIEGIEAYVGAASIPSKYNSSLSSQCGVILIWTRNPPPRTPKP